MRKIGVLILSTLLLTLSVSVSAIAVEKVSSGAACKKMGSTASVKGKTFVCIKEKGKLKWGQQESQVDPAKTENPIPTVVVLPVTPVVSLGKSDVEGVPVNASIFLDLKSFNAASKYFLVVNAPRGLYPNCQSGGMRTGASTLYNTSAPSRPKFEGRTLAFPIPSFPITMECQLGEAPEYKFLVIQAPVTNALETARSPITTVLLPNYVAPSPKPSPSISTSSKVEISAGQVCAPEGVSIVATDGQNYVCKKSSTDSSLRWAK
jgi:hypothetical protein